MIDIICVARHLFAARPLHSTYIEILFDYLNIILTFYLFQTILGQPRAVCRVLRFPTITPAIA